MQEQTENQNTKPALTLRFIEPRGMFNPNQWNVNVYERPVRNSPVESKRIKNASDAFEIDYETKCPTGWVFANVYGKWGFIRVDHRMIIDRPSSHPKKIEEQRDVK